jgi:hypothetical protein
VTGRRRRLPLDLLTGLGAGLLLVSLFLTWSHQLGRSERDHFSPAALAGVAADPTAFQVYASAGIVLALLAGAIAAAGLWGQRPLQALALAGASAGLAFVIRAAASAPTNGVLLAQGTGAHARYISDPATAGTGETLAMVGLICVVAGLLPQVVLGPKLPPS